MKNYKLLVPIALVVLLLLSAYMLFDSRKTTEEEYQGYLTAARAFREKGITVDADANYQSAYELRPSAALAVEIGEMYRQADLTRELRKWGDTLLETYPKEVGVYELLIQHYYEKKDYSTCYELAHQYEGRKLSSQKIDQILQDLTYTFELSGSYDDVSVFSNGRAAIQYDGKWGYVTESGGTAVYRNFQKAGAFSNAELAPVVDLEGNAYFIDPEGNKKQIIEGVQEVRELGYISGDVFPLFDGKTWAFYNLSGQKLFGDYDEVSALANGVAAVRTGEAWSLVDSTGTTVSKTTYFNVAMDEKTVACRNDRLFVEDMQGWHLIDSSGKEYGEVYDSAMLFTDDGPAAVEKNGKWGFVDASGKMVIEAKYDGARSFSNGFAAVKQGDLWGFIDTNEQMVIEPQFYAAKDFSSQGSAFVSPGNYWQLLTLYSFMQED